MKGMSLNIYVYEIEKHHTILLYEWLLECAQKLGIERGLALRSIAGYDKSNPMHEAHFFELGSNLPIELIFVSDRTKIDVFLEKLKQEKISVFYTLSEVDYGST
jgi:PII-like signaling protein